jgi:hypothetical protein
LINHVTLHIKVKKKFLNDIGGLRHARVKKLNPDTSIPAAVKMNEINPKYENTPVINQSKSRILI